LDRKKTKRLYNEKYRPLIKAVGFICQASGRRWKSAAEAHGAVTASTPRGAIFQNLNIALTIHSKLTILVVFSVLAAVFTGVRGVGMRKLAVMVLTGLAIVAVAWLLSDTVLAETDRGVRGGPVPLAGVGAALVGGVFAVILAARRFWRKN
jgi:hypothetical protein